MEENARPIIIILCHGESPSLALLRIHLPLHLPLPLLPLLLSSTPSFILLAPVSASTESAVLLFIPTNGGSFCFTFVLSNDEEEEREDLELHL